MGAAAQSPRAAARARFGEALRARDGFLVGSAIGSGFMARASESAGADFVLALNAGRLRSMGAPSITAMLPVFDANPLTAAFAEQEILTQCTVPVYLGVSVMHPALEPASLPTRLRVRGFTGVTNFPTAIHYTPAMRDLLERAGHGFGAEVAFLRTAQAAGLSALCYVGTREQARMAADAGIDLVCLNFGWNAGGAAGHRPRLSLEEVASRAREIARLSKRLHPGGLFLLEGGPIESAEQLAGILVDERIDGYVGGSTIDRLPLESSIAERIAAFKGVRRDRALTREAERELIAFARAFELVGASPAMCALYRQLRGLCHAAGPFCIVGEPGVPAQQVAALLHARGRPDVMPGEVALLDARNASAGPIGIQIFGRDGEAAGDRRPGLLERDAVTTVVLLHPERLSPRVQTRLARYCQHGFFTPAGSRRRVRAQTRIVFVAESVPSDTGERGWAPELVDLLRGWEIRLPPLRERADDIAELVRHLTRQIARVPLDRNAFASSAFRRLLGYDWPGNDRELRAFVGRLLALSPPTPIPLDAVNRALSPGLERAGKRMASERDKILDALWRCNFHRTRTAAELGISRKTLYNKILKYGLRG